MEPVCTTGLLCAVGKLSHGRIPASLTVERGNECALIEKRPDADRLERGPCVVEQVSTAPAMREGTQSEGADELTLKASKAAILQFPL